AAKNQFPALAALPFAPARQPGSRPSVASRCRQMRGLHDREAPASTGAARSRLLHTPAPPRRHSRPVGFVNSIWPTLILSFGPPKAPITPLLLPFLVTRS